MYPPSERTLTLEQVAALRQSIADLYQFEDMTMGWPQQGYIRFRGRFMCDPAVCFVDVRRRFEQHGFTPLLRQDQGETVLIAMPGVFDPPASNWVINLVLFLATILSTLFVGASGEPGFTGSQIWLGWPFSLSLLLILGAHELGHYFAARHHKVAVTLPYFIPLPLTLIGTLGAFIRLKAPMTDRRALLDIGAAGPLAGLVFAVPILLLGLATSHVGPLPASGGYLLEGNSLLYAAFKVLMYGRMLPDGLVDVQLNQVAWAGWVGLLVTGLNLIPVAQLDGGHIAYVLFGQKARYFFLPAILGLILLGLFVGNSIAQWGIWVALLLFMGNRHAQPLDDVTPADPRRKWIAAGCLLLFFLVFVPAPLTLMQ